MLQFYLNIKSYKENSNTFQVIVTFLNNFFISKVLFSLKTTNACPKNKTFLESNKILPPLPPKPKYKK